MNAVTGFDARVYCYVVVHNAGGGLTRAEVLMPDAYQRDSVYWDTCLEVIPVRRGDGTASGARSHAVETAKPVPVRAKRTTTAYEYKRVHVYEPGMRETTTVSLDWDTYFFLMSRVPGKNHREATKLVRETANALRAKGHAGTLSKATVAALRETLR